MNTSEGDIWSVLVSLNADRLRSENYFDTPKGPLNHINKKVQQKVDEEIQQFATRFDLPTLYALDMKLNWLIRKCANFIFHEDLMISMGSVDNIFYPLRSKFSKLQEMLDFQELSSELFEAKNVYQQSDQTELLVKRNMARLAMIQKALEDAIESNSTSPIVKAEQLLNSYLIANMQHCHNEALIYLLCQQSKNKHLNQEAISRLERFAVRTNGLSLVDRDPFFTIPQSNALRIAEWEYIRWFTNFNLRALPVNFVPKFYRPITILKADLAIIHRWPEIENWLEMLQRVFENLIYSPDRLLSRTGYMIQPSKITSAIASILVFAYYRIKGKYGKKKIVSKATDYLLENHEFCIFGPSDGYHRQSVTITAMAVHAIAMAKLPDSQEFLDKSKEWLLTNQAKYGHWFQPGENPDYTTVLVLDALELAKGGDRLTFKMDLKLDDQAIATHDYDSPKNQIPWIQVNYQTRRLTVGSTSVVLTGNMWELICELVSADGSGLPLAIRNKTRDWKGAVDMLRKKIGKENLKKVIQSVRYKTEDGNRKGAYKLTQDVRITGHGQVKIRKTRQRK